MYPSEYRGWFNLWTSMGDEWKLVVLFFDVVPYQCNIFSPSEYELLYSEALVCYSSVEFLWLVFDYWRTSWLTICKKLLPFETFSIQTLMNELKSVLNTQMTANNEFKWILNQKSPEISLLHTVLAVQCMDINCSDTNLNNKHWDNIGWLQIPPPGVRHQCLNVVNLLEGQNFTQMMRWIRNLSNNNTWENSW